MTFAFTTAHVRIRNPPDHTWFQFKQVVAFCAWQVFDRAIMHEPALFFLGTCEMVSCLRSTSHEPPATLGSCDATYSRPWHPRLTYPVQPSALQQSLPLTLIDYWTNVAPADGSHQATAFELTKYIFAVLFFYSRIYLWVRPTTENATSTNTSTSTNRTPTPTPTSCNRPTSPPAAHVRPGVPCTSFLRECDRRPTGRAWQPYGHGCRHDGHRDCLLRLARHSHAASALLG